MRGRWRPGSSIEDLPSSGVSKRFGNRLMPNKRNETRFAGKRKRLLVVVMWMSLIGLMLSAGCLTTKSTGCVSDLTGDRQIILLNEGEPAPYVLVGIKVAYFNYLKRCEDYIKSRGVVP